MQLFVFYCGNELCDYNFTYDRNHVFHSDENNPYCYLILVEKSVTFSMLSKLLQIKTKYIVLYPVVESEVFVKITIVNIVTV